MSEALDIERLRIIHAIVQFSTVKRLAQCIGNQRKCRGGLASAGVIQRVARERGAPVFQDAHESAFLKMGLKFLLGQVGNAKSRQCCLYDVDRLIERELSVYAQVLR